MMTADSCYKNARQADEFIMQAPAALDLQDVAALDSIARQTTHLWQALSACIAKIEAGIEASASKQADGAARVLPADAAQVSGHCSEWLCAASHCH